MTGRENIYMNGAIMGMTKAEITLKLDEIIDFSGVERYIDTPAKRYSSGMTVRLGFAIAAYLEPEILVVDEVLAVGDAEFQKKAIGKMQDVSRGEGRTVLFVSHNMGAIANLCTRCVCLENGTVYVDGSTTDVIANYLDRNNQVSNQKISTIVLKNGLFDVSNFSFKQFDIENNILYQGSSIECQFEVSNNSIELAVFEFNIEIKTSGGESVTCFGNQFQNYNISLKNGERKVIVGYVEELLLKKGNYYVNLYFKFKYGDDMIDSYTEDAIMIEVNEATPLYFVDNQRNWKMFPERHQHGFLNMKLDSIIQSTL